MRTWLLDPPPPIAPEGRFQIDTLDAADLAWSPDGAKLAVWDSPLSFKVGAGGAGALQRHPRRQRLIAALSQALRAHRCGPQAVNPAHHLRVLPPQVLVHDAGDGSLLGSFSAYDDALGVKAVTWAPGGDALAVGSYDQVRRGPRGALASRCRRARCGSPPPAPRRRLRCPLPALCLPPRQAARVLNPVTWQPLLECRHGSPVDGPRGVAVYQEMEDAARVLAPMQVSLPAGGGRLPAPAACCRHVPPPRRGGARCGRSRAAQPRCVAAQAPQAGGSPVRREARARYAVGALPVEVTSVAPAKDKPNPKLGVGRCRLWGAIQT